MRRRSDVGKFLQMSSARFGKRNRACATRCFCSIRNRFAKFAWCRISSAKVISPRRWFRASWSWMGRSRHARMDRSGIIVSRSEIIQLMTELLLKRASEVAPDVDPAETSLLIVAHGTDLNENSAVAAKREVEKIRALGKYAAVLNVYMEEAAAGIGLAEINLNSKRGGRTIFYFGRITQLRRHSAAAGNRGTTASPPSMTAMARLRKPPARKEIFRRNPYALDGRICFTLHPSAPTRRRRHHYRAGERGRKKLKSCWRLVSFARDCFPANERNHVQEASGDRGVRVGRRVHAKANEATRGDDSRGARLSLGRRLQDH